MIYRTIAKVIFSTALAIPALAHAALPIIDVYKSASCRCCAAWVKHMKDNGFTVRTHDVANPSDYREKFGIPNQFGSCHTAIVGGYAIEGHVPASDMVRLLAAKPKDKGLAVPAMPAGSPGMEGPRKDPFDVVLVKADGTTSVYKHYN
jgi:hypothetical protein